jgi:AraC family transcriptional regulator of adaptative response/methylated-DNA-[protein]-cysteine methyltransferase
MKTLNSTIVSGAVVESSETGLVQMRNGRHHTDQMSMKTMELLPPSGTMYRALVNRDASFEGIFFVGVRTTGIFCRPTCSAKTPARMNVDFFASASEALHGGYRPCLRCRPMDPGQPPPRLVERLRAEVERTPDGRLTDKELAALAIDPSTARRQFKRHYGMTFQAYHRARRMGRALRQVRRGGRVDEAQNRSGFESASGFRDAFARIFGDSPIEAKSRTCMFAERIDTPLGTMLAVADDEGLRLLEFADRRALERELMIVRQRLKTNVVPGEHRYLDATRTQSHLRRSGAISSIAPGKPCVRSPWPKRVPIRGWRNSLVILVHAAP